ncbi:MAG: hypothetical protein IKN63_06885 [Bacilli bacterium]|nr:hypothetical protein [Bacilli bacterium]
MDLILNLFTTKELLIIGGVIGSLIFIVLMLTIWDIVSRKRKESRIIEDAFDEKLIQNIEDNIEIQKLNKEESLKVETQVVETLDMDVVPIRKNENLDEVESLEVDSKKIEQKVDNIEPLVIEVEEEKLDNCEKAKLELLEIEESLKNPKSLEDTLYDLEAIEEENAIISYQELLETTKQLNIVNVDSGDEPISITEIMNMCEQPLKNEKSVSDEINIISVDEAYKGDFTSTPYLSPIVGYENDTNQSVQDLAEIQLENTANLEKLDKEIRKTNEFLTILNDLKKNLD